MQEAFDLAIEPMVAKYVDKWNALEASDQIQRFQQTIQSAVKQQFNLDLETSPEAKPVRAMMLCLNSDFTGREGGQSISLMKKLC